MLAPPPSYVQADLPKDVIERVIDAESLNDLLCTAGRSGSQTETAPVIDLTALLSGTWNAQVAYEEALPADPRQAAPTLMVLLMQKADLSLREWGTLFGVSYQTISNWRHTDPSSRVAELEANLELLTEARRRHPRLGVWMRTPLGDQGTTPLELLREHRGRAFRAAARLVPNGVTPDAQTVVRLRDARNQFRAFTGPETAGAPPDDEL